MNEIGYFEEFCDFLPKYLTFDQQRSLFEDLKRFPCLEPFYLSSFNCEDRILQGDGWQGFVVIDFETLSKKSVSGVILSNSCDIDPQNVRMYEANVVFSPLIKVSKYIANLERSGIRKEKIEAHLGVVRKQLISSVFWLPDCGDLVEESIILLDNLHSYPAAKFIEAKRNQIFTLSQAAFYVFLFKISIHFSRFREGIARF